MSPASTGADAAMALATRRACYNHAAWNGPAGQDNRLRQRAKTKGKKLDEAHTHRFPASTSGRGSCQASAQQMNADDLKWINQCIQDNRDEPAGPRLLFVPTACA